MILITMMILLMKASVKTMKIRLKIIMLEEVTHIYWIDLKVGWVYIKVICIPVNTAGIRQDIRVLLRNMKNPSMKV